MLARVLIIVIVNAAFFAAVLWLIPVESILAARGYTPTQIAKLETFLASENAPAQPADTQPTPGAKPNNKNGDTTMAERASSAHTAKAGATGGQARSRQPESEPRLVATATVNVRAGQSTNDAVIGQVTKGDTVTVVKDFGGDWIKIRDGGLTGWAYRPLFEQAGGQAAAESHPITKLVSTATVNVRTGPDTKYDAVGQVSPGDVVTVLKDPGGDWIRVQHGTLRGWTYKPLFKPVEN